MCGACPRPGPWSSRGHPAAASTCAIHRSDACVADRRVGSLERSPPTVAAWVALHFLFRGWTEPISRPELHAIQKHCFAALIRWHAARSDCLVRSAHARNFGRMLDDQTNPIRTSFPIVTHDGRRNFTMRPSLLWHNCTLGKAGCTPTTVTATTAPQSQPPNIYNSNQISNGSRQVRTSRYSS